MSRSIPFSADSGFADEIRATFRLALPLIVGQLATMAANVVELILAGHLGAHVLGAVAVGGSVWGMAVITMAGLMMTVSPSVAQLDGAKRRGEVAPLFCQAVWLAAAAGVVTAALLYAGGPMLARVTGVSEDLLPDVAAFLHPASFAAPPIILYFACRGLSEGLSLARPTMLLGLLGLVALVPIGYTLMYVLQLGAYGSGLAMAAVCWLLFLGFAVLIAVGPRYRGLGWHRRGLQPDFDVISALARLGLPMAVTLMLEAAFFSMAGLEIGRFGDAAVAGHQVAVSVASVTLMPRSYFCTCWKVRPSAAASCSCEIPFCTRRIRMRSPIWRSTALDRARACLDASLREPACGLDSMRRPYRLPPTLPAQLSVRQYLIHYSQYLYDPCDTQ
jgi:MATE family multidrug resistance protein